MKYPLDFFGDQQEPRLIVGDCNYNVFPEKCPDINNIVINDLVLVGGDAKVIKDNLSSTNYWKDASGLKQTVDGVQYCLYNSGDAGMGHVFNYYYFTTVRDNKCVAVYFATNTTNCDFYLPLEEGNTRQADEYNKCVKTNKDQPVILSEIISTFRFISEK